MKQAHNRLCVPISNLWKNTASVTKWFSYVPKINNHFGKQLRHDDAFIYVVDDYTLLFLHSITIIIPSAQRSFWGILVSIRPSVCPSRIPCQLCSSYSFSWIHFICIHIIKQLQKVCRVKSFLQNLRRFRKFLKFVTLTLSCSDLGSDVNH